MFLKTSGLSPSLNLAAFDIGKSDLALLPCKIYNGIYKLPVMEVFQ